ncbi:MAG: pyridine nucleotide-disulfide oxidoreductase [Beggiatoa sp. IS2]|nr:MAG: pyridine nucleotide-disulfide oxidoreductase [Beggiatoa sp. IS2]
MAHVVILGAGLGGLPAAYAMKATLGQHHEVTVVNAAAYFQFVPSLPWVALGWRERIDITLPLAPLLASKHINFIAGTVTYIDANHNRLHLANCEIIDYDYLLLTTGPELAYAEVPGLGPLEGFTQSVCTIGEAEQAYKEYKKLLDKPGPVVIGAVRGTSCFGPAYEFALMLDTDLRRYKRRQDIPITFVTSEPYLGHLGLGGIGESKSMLEAEFQERGIQWLVNASVLKAKDGVLFVEEHGQYGETLQYHELPFHYAMLMPAFRGVTAVANVEGLCTPRGFVTVDDFQRNKTYPNIYAAGVCIAIPPVEITPVPTAIPKTGYMIESMVWASVLNIRDELHGQEPLTRASWNTICLADMGNTGAAFVAIPQIPPRNITWTKKGPWAHLAKVGYEKFFLRQMKQGSGESIYEKYILKAIGLGNLRS